MSTIGARTARTLIQTMTKHLPPSASTLHILDVEGAAGAILSEGRADLAVTAVHGDPSAWHVEPNFYDAVVAFDRPTDARFLDAVMRAMRPGGRMILMDVSDAPAADSVATLENAGYTRILVETGIECPLPIGRLMRGEKPHITDDTLTRVKVASDQDGDLLDLAAYSGRYLHLLIRQTPNKPVWKLTSDDVIAWTTAALTDQDMPVVLAFSSLPKAVAFMQPAVLNRQITDVNKVAKFSLITAQKWTFAVMLNPTAEAINGRTVAWLPIDRDSAEAADE